jgi:hypothetical protein
MILQGLYHLIATKRAAAGAAARTARECEAKDPRMAHECNETAERLAIEAEEAAEHAKANEELMENANKLLHYMATSRIKTRYRSLAMTDLESFINWLHRENGDREPERNFEILPPTPAINGQAVS